MMEVKIFLKKNLLPLIASMKMKSKVEKWIDELTLEEEDSRDKNRLACSIAIDIKNSHLDHDMVAKLFSDIDFEDLQDTPEFQFEQMLRINKFKIFVGSKFGDLQYPSTQYCTIQSWGKLASKCLFPSGADQYETLYKMFVENKSQPLSKISNWSNYSRKIVWILPLQDLLAYFKSLMDAGAKSHEITEKTLDYIGVYNGYSDPSSNLAKYVYIKYPSIINFNCFQPTTLACDWTEKDGLFLSFKNLDGYGRTFCTCGNYKIGEEAKERIHVGTDYVTDDFKIFPLGIPSKVITKNTDSLLSIAQKRFDE